MKALFDSNVLVAALVETHPFHLKAIKWLTKAKEHEIVGVASAHSLAEVYSSLTNLPIYPNRVKPEPIGNSWSSANWRKSSQKKILIFNSETFHF